MSHSVWMPETVGAPGPDFPAVFHAAASEYDLATWGPELRKLLDAELHVHGAVVVRGLPVLSAQDFSALLHATNMSLSDYLGGVTSRPHVAPKVPQCGESSQS